MKIRFTLVKLIIVSMIAFGAIGWVWNIVKVVHTDLTPLTTMLIVRIVGIFVMPLGAVVGYF